MNDFYISVALIAVSALITSFIGLPILRILQLSGYKAKGIFSWWKATKLDTLIRYVALTVMSAIAVVVYVGCFGVYEYARYAAPALYVALAVVFAVAARKSYADIKMTGRMTRLVIATVVLDLGLGAAIAFAAYHNVFCQVLVCILGVLAPFVAIAANAILTPVEKLDHSKYIRRAKKKLAEQKPIVIGITGSFGKTTAKNMLKAMLSKSGTVLATPGSFNTPMGICKTVNDMLCGEKYFIAEMGARYKGDIRELCDIIKPSLGVITAIGDMHIETLKSREGVKNAKFELAESLPTDGYLALNGYNADCAELAERNVACAVALVGEGGDVYYKDLKIGADGTRFTLVISGEEHDVTVKLLGAHIAELACVTAAIALRCGVSPADIAAALSELEPVEHRLQLLPQRDPSVVVIDDAYNSNPIGASNALDVLACFDGRKKVVITPGFVELGVIEKSCNASLGKKIAETCDYAYLIGTRADDIKSGAVAAGMSEDAIKTFGSRDEAVEMLAEIDGDKAVLFENDLPDNIK